MAANAAVMTPAGSDYTYLYVDSCLYRYMEGQLQLYYALDELNEDGNPGAYSTENTEDRLDTAWSLGQYFAGAINSTRAYCEYGAVSGDVDGSGADLLATSMLSIARNTGIGLGGE